MTQPYQSLPVKCIVSGNDPTAISKLTVEILFYIYKVLMRCEATVSVILLLKMVSSFLSCLKSTLMSETFAGKIFLVSKNAIFGELIFTIDILPELILWVF